MPMNPYVPFIPKNKNLNLRPSLRVASVYTLDTSNVGDLASTPARYVTLPGTLEHVDIHHAINDQLLTPDRFDATIIGGGASGWVFGQPMYSSRILTATNIVWGLGASNIGPNALPRPDRFQLVGFRDWMHPCIDDQRIFYVPCASCMSRLFDVPRGTPEHRYVFFLHKLFTGDFDTGNAPVMTNYDEFASVVDFLSSGAVVVTNSYHGAYWATLLGRPVVFVDPRPKAKTFKYTPTFTTKDEWRDATASGDLKSYPDALEECRKINLNFYKRVLDLLTNLPSKR
jgi:hypothetical protein